MKKLLAPIGQPKLTYPPKDLSAVAKNNVRKGEMSITTRLSSVDTMRQWWEMGVFSITVYYYVILRSGSFIDLSYL